MGIVNISDRKVTGFMVANHLAVACIEEGLDIVNANNSWKCTTRSNPHSRNSYSNNVPPKPNVTVVDTVLKILPHLERRSNAKLQLTLVVTC